VPPSTRSLASFRPRLVKERTSFDDLDLLVATTGQDDVKVALLFDRVGPRRRSPPAAGAAAATGAAAVHAELLLKLFEQFAQFNDGEIRDAAKICALVKVAAMVIPFSFLLRCRFIGRFAAGVLGRRGSIGIGLGHGGLSRDLRDNCRGVVARCRCSFLDPAGVSAVSATSIGTGATTTPPLESIKAARP